MKKRDSLSFNSSTIILLFIVMLMNSCSSNKDPMVLKYKLPPTGGEIRLPLGAGVDVTVIEVIQIMKK